MRQTINPLTGIFDQVNDDTGFKTVKVQELPEQGVSGVMYVVEGSGYSTTYVWSNGEFIMTGSTAPVNQKQSDWAQEDSGQVDYIKNKPDVVPQVQSDWNEEDNMSKSYILNKPTLSEVATSGDYNDLLNKPEQVQSDWTQADVDAVDYIKNKPTIPNPQVQSDWNQNDATAVDYIKNKPTIPAEQIQSDWSQTNTNAKDYIKNKPTIPAAQVNADWNANSGVSQILNKPTIPTVNNGRLRIQKNGTDIAIFYANESDDIYADIPIPEYLSELINDSGFVTTTVNNLQNYYTSTNTYTKTEVDNLIQNITTLQFEVVSTLPSTGQSNIIYLLQVSGGYDQYIYSNNTWTKIGTTSVDLSNYVQKTDTLLTINGTAYTQGDLVSVFDGDYNNLTNKPIIPAAQVQSNWAESDTTSKAYIQNKPTIPAAQIQSDWTQADNTAKDYIKNKPSLSTVATSGDYADLTNKPSIPAAQIQSDWNQTNTSSADYIKNKPTIPAAQVQADWNQNTTTAVDYIKNKPTIPTVNNATLTIQKNSTSVGTFTANASTNKTINITVPTKTSELTNNSGFITSSSLPSVGNGTITINQGGVQKGTFTTNQTGNTTINLDAGAGLSGVTDYLSPFAFAGYSRKSYLYLSGTPKVMQISWSAYISSGIAYGNMYLINSGGGRNYSANQVTYYQGVPIGDVFGGTGYGDFRATRIGRYGGDYCDVNIEESSGTITITVDNTNSQYAINMFMSFMFYF